MSAELTSGAEASILIAQHHQGDICVNASQRLQLGLLPVRRLSEYVWNHACGNGHLPVRPYYAALDVTYRCNLKCVHCSLWDRPAGEEEMTLDEMKEIVLKLKSSLNLPAIDILGGEAFLRPDTMKLIRFATEQGVFVHIVTNGTMLSDRVARELIELHVYKIAISLDGFNAEAHDRTRGVPGAFRRTVKAVERLKRLKDELKGSTRISIHTILDAATLDTVPDVLEWVAQTGLDGFHLVPLDQNVGGVDHGPTAYNFEDSWFEQNPLWIRDIAKLERVIEHVIQKKADGYPIADPVTYLQHTIPYFRDAGGIQYKRPCRAGSEVIKVTPKGALTFCPYEPPIGDLRTSTFEELWTSEQAKVAREKIGACTKKCFIPFCSWDEKERLGRFWEQFVQKSRQDFVQTANFIDPVAVVPQEDALVQIRGSSDRPNP